MILIGPNIVDEDDNKMDQNGNCTPGEWGVAPYGDQYLITYPRSRSGAGGGGVAPQPSPSDPGPAHGPPADSPAPPPAPAGAGDLQAVDVLVARAGGVDPRPVPGPAERPCADFRGPDVLPGPAQGPTSPSTLRRKQLPDLGSLTVDRTLEGIGPAADGAWGGS
jgi:hypothetical protein